MTRALMVRIEVQWFDLETYEQGPGASSRRVLRASNLRRPQDRAGASYGALLLVRREMERAMRELMSPDGLAKLRVLLEDEWQPSALLRPAIPAEATTEKEGT